MVELLKEMAQRELGVHFINIRFLEYMGKIEEIEAKIAKLKEQLKILKMGNGKGPSKQSATSTSKGGADMGKFNATMKGGITKKIV
jgi:hypothetical protein